MTEEQIVALLPFVLILVVGLVLGGLIGGVISSTMQGSNPTAKAPPSRNLGQVAGLWRDKRNGRLSVEMDDIHYVSIDKLPSRQVSLLLQAFNDLQIWLKVDNLSSRLEATASPRPQTPRIVEPVVLEEPILDQPEEEVIEPVKVSVNEIVTGAILPKSKTKLKAIEKPKSIVEQVDAVLQARLAKSIYKERVIRLVDSPSGGVEVLVDGNRYDGVDNVPEFGVRSFIQDCVKEWEKGK